MSRASTVWFCGLSASLMMSLLAAMLSFLSFEFGREFEKNTARDFPSPKEIGIPGGTKMYHDGKLNYTFKKACVLTIKEDPISNEVKE